MASNNSVIDTIKKAIKDSHDIFLNKDEPIKQGSRIAVPTAKSELVQELSRTTKKIIRQNGYSIKEAEDMTYDYGNDVVPMVQKILEWGKISQLQKDINEIATYHIKEKITGFETTDDGATYLLLALSAPNHSTIYKTFYFDGKKIRCYTPIRGNPFNLLTKEVWGANKINDFATICKNIGIKNKADCEDIFKQISLNPDNIKADLNLIRQEMSEVLKMNNDFEYL